MKHEFTDSEISVAADQAVDTASYYRTIPIDYHKAFLDALPDVPHCGDCAVDRAKAGVYEQLLDHPFFEGWSEADASVEDYMIGRLNEAHAAEQDEWEAYDVKAVRKGDRVRWTVPGCEDNESYEIDVVAVTNHTTDGGVVLHSKIGSYFFPYGAVVDRIPAPVTHPDPDFHPVVISSVGDAWVWDDADEHYIEIGGGGHRGPGDFGSGWVSGKVEAANENSSIYVCHVWA